ncbi:uncharacterized protein PAE49_002255 [Odontesthes bonariensis]|uniref:uncharacterized protein LOC142375081 n=1 Tax=Odontesthes bonariensis TaxID=219752 RepID=UPI003F58C0F6
MLPEICGFKEFRQRMTPLIIILIFMLQIKGISGRRRDFLYKRSGDEVVLPCNSDASGFPCEIVDWLYNRDVLKKTQKKVRKGKVVKDSAAADRLSVNTDCSLVINNVTDEDVGLYTCRLGQDDKFDGNVFLSTLTISPSPPDADIKKDGEVTLTCSLLRYDFGPCGHNSVRWVDEKGTVLLGKGVGYEFRGQKNCVSYLTVNHQSDNRRFTCQFWEGNTLKIDAHYTPVFPDDETSNTIIIIGAAVGGVVVLLFIITAVLIKRRRRAGVTEDPKITTNVLNPTDHNDEPESNVTYAAVDHFYPSGSPKITLTQVEDMVTYSTVKTQPKTEVDNDPSSFYSCVNLPK